MAPINLVSRLLGLPLFPNFPRLPKELRDAIWEYAVCEPRIVPLRRHRLASHASEENENTAGDRNEGLWGFKCDLPPPAILFVNRESHEVASRFYTTSKAFPCIRYNHTSVPETCINFEKDTLYLDADWTLQIHYRPGEVDKAEREKVQHLAVLYVKTDDSSFEEELAGRECISENELWLAQYLAYFTNLKTITVVLEYVECPKYEEGYTSEERATFAFTDQPDEPMDVNAALEIFENKTETPEHAAIPTHPRFMTLDMDLLGERRLVCLRGRAPPEGWQMPKIEQRVMVTTGLKAILDKNLKQL
jgi:hypothetical protein